MHQRNDRGHDSRLSRTERSGKNGPAVGAPAGAPLEVEPHNEPGGAAEAKTAAHELPPGRYTYGAPPGWFEYIDEGGMRGQATYGGSRYGGLGIGANYPMSDSPTASYPMTQPFPEFPTGIDRTQIGKGPKGYVRSDERIREDASDCLTDAPIDASNIHVEVKDGIVTLSGTIDNKYAQRLAEDVVERVRGVKHVENLLRTKRAKHA